MTLIFDLLTLELVCNVTSDMDNLAANLGASASFLCRVMCKHTSSDDVTYSEVTARVGDAGHRILFPCTKLEVRRPSRSEDRTHFRLGVNRPRHLHL